MKTVHEDFVPAGHLKIVGAQEVFIGPRSIVVLGVPPEDSDHDCDGMGCGSLDHVLYRGKLLVTDEEIIEHTRQIDFAKVAAHLEASGAEFAQRHQVTQRDMQRRWGDG